MVVNEKDYAKTAAGACLTWKDTDSEQRIVRLRERPDLKEQAAEWFSSKWNVPESAYLESIEESLSAVVPSWYLCPVQGDGEEKMSRMYVHTEGGADQQAHE